MAQNAVHALRDSGAIFGPGIAAGAEPLAQEAVRGLCGLLKRVDDLDRGLEAGARRHGPLAAAGVVRALARDNHAVDMRLVHASTGDTDELGLLLEVLDRGTTGV